VYARTEPSNSRGPRRGTRSGTSGRRGTRCAASCRAGAPGCGASGDDRRDLQNGPVRGRVAQGSWIAGYVWSDRRDQAWLAQQDTARRSGGMERLPPRRRAPMVPDERLSADGRAHPHRWRRADGQRGPPPQATTRKGAPGGASTSVRRFGLRPSHVRRAPGFVAPKPGPATRPHLQLVSRRRPAAAQVPDHAAIPVASVPTGPADRPQAGSGPEGTAVSGTAVPLGAHGSAAFTGRAGSSRRAPCGTPPARGGPRRSPAPA
jgi:hypothetical protein